MPTLIDRLIKQLDSLVPFLALEHRDFFVVLERHFQEWYPQTSPSSLPENLALYQTQVAHAGFLLGYSFFEAFLSDLMREVYRSMPILLPKDKTLKYEEIRELTTYDAVLNCMIEKEVSSACYGSMANIRDYFEKRLNLPWPSSEDVVIASLVRNCIVHNNSIVDRRLAEKSGYEIGQQIALNADDVHDFGIEGRSIARELYELADKKYFGSEQDERSA